MIRKLAGFLLHRILGYKTIGNWPEIDKYILVVAPHTSNLDFFISVLERKKAGEQINFIGKSALFKWPHGFIFRYAGGVPIDRSSSQNKVEATAQVFKERKKFRMAIAPEGTRSEVDRWKTGFYHIAVAAGVPIASVELNLKNKTIEFLPVFYPTGNIEHDMPLIQKQFKYMQ